jgi:hypothetical protein
VRIIIIIIIITVAVRTRKRIVALVVVVIGMMSIFSCSKSVMDYVTLPGIRNRVGVDTEPDLITYAVKELLDNALEFIERNASKRKSVSVKPYIDVLVTKAPIDNFVTRVRNSNFGISNSSFSSKGALKSVFFLLLAIIFDNAFITSAWIGI